MASLSSSASLCAARRRPSRAARCVDRVATRARVVRWRANASSSSSSSSSNDGDDGESDEKTAPADDDDDDDADADAKLITDASLKLLRERMDAIATREASMDIVRLLVLDASGAFYSHWFPYDRVGVVNAVP